MMEITTSAFFGTPWRFLCITYLVEKVPMPQESQSTLLSTEKIKHAGSSNAT